MAQDSLEGSVQEEIVRIARTDCEKVYRDLVVVASIADRSGRVGHAAPLEVGGERHARPCPRGRQMAVGMAKGQEKYGLRRQGELPETPSGQ